MRTGEGWYPKWNVPERLEIAGETVYCPGRRYAKPPRESDPGPKSRFLKFTFGSVGTVSWGFVAVRPALNSSIERPTGSPRSARGTETSLNSRSPNWKEACVPFAEALNRPAPSHRAEVAFQR